MSNSINSSNSSNNSKNNSNENQQREYYAKLSQKFNAVIKFIVYFLLISFVLIFGFFTIIRFLVLPKITENSENITNLINANQNLVSVKIQTIKPVWSSHSFLIPGVAFENIHVYSKQQNSQEILRIKSAETILAFENIWHFADIYKSKKIPKFIDINIIEPEFYIQFFSNAKQEDIIKIANVFDVNLTELIYNKTQDNIDFFDYLFQQQNINIKQAKVYIFNKNLQQKLANNYIIFSWKHTQPYLKLQNSNKKINEIISLNNVNFELFNELNLLKNKLDIKKIFGSLNNIKANISIEKNTSLENVISDYKIQAAFNNLGLQYVKNITKNKNENVGENNAENNNDDIIKTLGINNISGNLNIVSNSKSSNNSEKLNPNIKINLDSKNILLYLPDIFDTTIKKNNETINNDNNNNNNKISNLLNLFHLKGKIDIHNFNVKNSTRNQINFLDFSFANNDVSNGKFDGLIRFDGYVNLNATADSANANQVYKYLPLVISRDVRNWVKNAVISGNGSNVKFKMKGNISNFPFRNIGNSETENNEIFYISADVKNGELHYANNWLPIKNIAANLEFFGIGMRIVSDSANILKTQISNTSIEIPDFLTFDEQLLIKGNANGETNEFLEFLKYGDLAKKIDNVIEKIKLKATNNNATADLKLDLKLPLRNFNNVKILGEVNIKNNNLQLLPNFLPIMKNVSANLTFTENSVYSDNIVGELLEGKILSKLDANSNKISIYNSGKVDFYKTLNTYFLVPNKIHNYLNVNSNLFRGNISFKDELTIFNNVNSNVVNNNIYYNLVADLKEAEILLPEYTSLNKKLNEDAKFHLVINNNFDNLLLANFQKNNTNIFNVVSDFSDNKKHLNLIVDFLKNSNNYPELNKAISDNFHNIVINYNGDFVLQNWLDFYDHFAPKDDANSAKNNTNNSIKNSPILVEFNAANNNIFHRNIHNLNLKSHITTNENNHKFNYNFDINSDEVTAKLAYISPNEQHIKGLINADISHLKYTHKKLNDNAKSSEQNDHFPDIILKADDVWLDDISLGHLQFEAKNQTDSHSWKVEKLLIKNPDGELNGRGFWHPAINPLRDGHDEVTRLDFNLNSGDVGKLLERFGYKESFQKGEAKLEGILQWQGRPTSIDYPSLAGKLSVDVKNGQFSKFEPGVGRLLGLISLQSVLKRLTLNFSDVFSQGLAFSEIEGEFDIQNGIFKTLNDKPLKITAPAATVQISGQTDLAKETQNISATIYPEVGFFTSLGLAMVNPIAGAASALVSSVGKNPIDKLFNYKYHIAGTWDNPIVDGEEKTEVAKNSNSNSNSNNLNSKAAPTNQINQTN